jgi:O-antigen ligase
MPPPVALLLCTLFVLVIIRVAQSATPRVSSVLWIPTIWMLSIGTKSLGMWFSVAGANETGSVPDQLLLLSLGIAAIVVLVRRRFGWSRAFRRHEWLVALLLYMLVSTLWSDITFIAFKRWVRELIVVVMALVLMSEDNPRQALEILLRRSAYILMPFSLLLINYYPALGREYTRWSGKEMWIGVSVHKNSLGSLCLVSAVFLLWALHRRWTQHGLTGGRYQSRADAAVLLITLYLLKGPQDAYSATSIGAFAVSIATLLGLNCLRMFKLRVPQPGLLVLIVFLIGFGVSAPFLGGSNIAAASSTLGRDATLTGRTDTWTELIPVVEREPLLGYGFGSFWTTDRRDLYQMSFAHNGYLDILLELGVVGLSFYTVWLLSCVRKIHCILREDYNWACLAICFLVTSLVYNGTESALNTFAEQITAVIALASVGSAK